MTTTRSRANNGTLPKTVRFGLLCILFLALLAACGRSGPGPKKQQPPIPVQMAEVVLGDSPEYLEGIGNAAAYNSVDIRSRVTGELIRKFFDAGDQLVTGQQLFIIDPAPFQAKVKEGEAKLKQSQVQYEQAKRDYERFKSLFAEKAVSQEQLETKEVDMHSKQFQAELNQAELETARLNLGYCFINSPLDGKAGDIYIDNFNIIMANQDKLVTIKQTKPIKIRFSVPGKFLDEVRKYYTKEPLSTEAIIPGNDRPEKGALTLIDNAINTRTGMVMLEGTFPNKEDRLWPGQFVRVRLNLSLAHDATLIPERAVNEGPEGQYVWVVAQDATVFMRPIKTGRRNRDIIVATEGLKPGEKVVTDGQLMLHPGARVVTREQMQQMMKKSGSGKNAGKDGKAKEFSGAHK
jgi:multidrug efflux system membrane fusion protein